MPSNRIGNNPSCASTSSDPLVVVTLVCGVSCGPLRAECVCVHKQQNLWNLPKHHPGYGIMVDVQFLYVQLSRSKTTRLCLLLQRIDRNQHRCPAGLFNDCVSHAILYYNISPLVIEI